jgi:metallophosphoesterase (TIGR00282 family)
VSKTINVFIIGDVVGQPGVDVVSKMLKGYISKYDIHFAIANGENAHQGKGMSKEALHEFQAAGINVITSGNHIWDNWKFLDTLKTERNILRPHNYPKGTYGSGFGVFDLPNKLGKIGVLNLQGRTYMSAIDCPFRGADWALEKMVKETNMVIVDMHAEATAEKMAMGWYLDGRVSAVVGTHTHIQTADERILPRGTAYITDLGMTGPYESVVGMEIEPATKRFLYQTPHKYELAKNDVRLCAVVVCIDPSTGRAASIERITFPDFTKTSSPSLLTPDAASHAVTAH